MTVKGDDMINEIENEIKTLLSMQQFLPNFNVYKSNVLFNLEEELMNENITLEQYKKYLNQIEKGCISKIDLTPTFISSKLDDYKIKIDVETLLKQRLYLDQMYAKLNESVEMIGETDDKKLAYNMLIKFVEKTQNGDYEAANNLFYCFLCFVRCHNIEILQSFSAKSVTSVFSITNTRSVEFLKKYDVKMLSAFGQPENYDISLALITYTVYNSLLTKDYQETVDSMIKLIKEKNLVSKITLSDLEQIEQLLEVFFSIEDDIEEIFLMIEMLERYSDYNICEVLGGKVISYVLDFISNYFIEFDDLDCYNFVVQNQLYFSNATNPESFRKAKIGIKDLLTRYQIQDYDSITD